MLKNCLSIWAIFRGGRSWFRGGRTPKIFRASRDNLFRASRDTHFRALRDFLGGGEADLGGGEPQNFFRASREIFFRATRETNLGLRPPLNQFRPPLKNLQEISPPPQEKILTTPLVKFYSNKWTRLGHIVHLEYYATKNRLNTFENINN